MRVLVVEDEPHVADLLRDVLTELGHEPRLAVTAEAGVAAFARDSFDAVLLDIRLPRMTGLDLLRAGTIQGRGSRVICISGAATEAEVRMGLQLGATDFLQKPVSIELMREVLDYTEGLDAAVPPGAERRRSPRRPLAIPVTIVESGLPPWETTSIDVSVFGMRVRGQAPRPRGHLVKLHFTPPDGRGELEVLALSVWRDANTQAFRFANLSAPTYERLQRLL
jgi:CheY-like chemotaxis protein